MKKQKYDYNYGGVEEDLSTGAILGFLGIVIVAFIGTILIAISIHPY